MHRRRRASARQPAAVVAVVNVARHSERAVIESDASAHPRIRRTSAATRVLKYEYPEVCIIDAYYPSTSTLCLSVVTCSSTGIPYECCTSSTWTEGCRPQAVRPQCQHQQSTPGRTDDVRGGAQSSTCWLMFWLVNLLTPSCAKQVHLRR